MLNFLDSIIGSRSADENGAADGMWAITDETLTIIDESIAAHEPERGGALIVASGSRFVIDFVPDPRDGESVNYWHSDLLRHELDSYLAAHLTRRYSGTLHSHPSGFAEPSGQDARAFADTLRNNPYLIDALFAIVVDKPKESLEVARKFGNHHLIDLAHGTFAGYTVKLTKTSIEVLPASMRIVPLREDVDSAITAVLHITGVALHASATSTMTVDQQNFPAVKIVGPNEGALYLIFDTLYPSAAPTIASERDVYRPTWDDAEESVAQLARAIMTDFDLDHEPRRTMTQERAEMESRLRGHLPNGVDAKCLIVGAGSVGSHAAELLVRSGMKDFILVDHDVVELPNLSRTTYTRADVGRVKVEALKDALLAIAPDIAVAALPNSIQDIDLTELNGVDVAVLAADDLAAEFWLGHHLYERGIRSVSIKMFAGGDAGEIVVVDPSAGTPCVHCLIGDASGDRGSINYGTGRIDAAAALGPDIVATVARGVKVVLALTQPNGPLADWLRPMIDNSRTYFQQSNVAGWKYLRPFNEGRPTPAFDAKWFRADLGQAECRVCGENRVEAPEAFGGPVFDGLPPGVNEGSESSGLS